MLHFVEHRQLLTSGEEWKLALIEGPLMKEVKLAVAICFYLSHWGLHGESALTLLLWFGWATERGERSPPYLLPRKEHEAPQKPLSGGANGPPGRPGSGPPSARPLLGLWKHLERVSAVSCLHLRSHFRH